MKRNQEAINAWALRMLEVTKKNPCPEGVLAAPEGWLKSRYKEYVAEGGELGYDDWADTLTN